MKTSKKTTTQKAPSMPAKAAPAKPAAVSKAPAPRDATHTRPGCYAAHVLAHGEGKTLRDLIGICDAAYVKVGGKSNAHESEFCLRNVVNALSAVGLVAVTVGTVSIVGKVATK